MSIPNKNKKHDSVPTGVERTGEKDFVVKHDDGSYFEGKVDHSSRFNAFRNLKGTGRIYTFGGIGEKKPLVCDQCKKVVHKITYKDGCSLCGHCL